MNNEVETCANIEKLTKLLNDELRTAHELGLKIHLGGSIGPLFRTGPPELQVRVWRETTLVNVPKREFVLHLKPGEKGDGKR